MALSAGDRLGRYEILEPLGAGGMGEVYRARDTVLERDVAVKVLPETVAQDPDRLERFQREARAVAKLSHPNILEIHDFGHVGEISYAVTELLEGENLRERLGSSSLGWKAAATIGADIADGLSAAHERGVIHRDLKPGNLFLTTDGRVKILDFGLARVVERSTPEAATEGLEETITKQGAVLGTAGYMSPEQVRGRPADRRSDIFSLGCVLYEMLAGRRAFKGDTQADTMAAVLTADPEEMSALGAEVPADLEMAIRKCLHKTPASRLQSAADLGYVLRAVVGESSGRPEARVVPTKRALMRLIPVVAVGILVLVATALWMKSATKTPPGAEISADFDPNRVVVAKFENRIGDPSLDDFGIHVADSITTLLRQVDRLTVATNPFRSGARGAGHQGEVAKGDPLRRLAEATRSGFVVTGACYSRGDQVEIRASIVDPWQDEVKQTFAAVRAPRSDPSSAVGHLSQQVAGTLALHVGNVVPLGLSRPVQLAAYQEFVGAMDHWGIDRDGITSGLKRALAIEPTFVQARSYLFRWHIAQGRVRDAEAEREVFEDQLPTMTPFNRLAVVAVRARFEKRPLEELRATREAVGLAPTSYWLLRELGKQAIAVNRPSMAVEALSRIPYDWTAGGTAFASSPYFELCFALHMLGDYEAQLRVAAESHEHFPDRMVFYGLQGNALAAMGRFEEMDHIVEESLTISVRGSSWGFSQTFTARELRAHGFRERSLQLAERVVDWYRERPDEILWSPSGPAWGFAAALNAAERWHEARDVAEQLARDRPDDVQWLGLLGVLEARIGNEDEAQRIGAELFTSEDKHSRAERSYWRACITAQLGQLDEAMRLLQRAFSEGLPFSDEFHRDINLEPLWDYPSFKELIRPKG